MNVMASTANAPAPAAAQSSSSSGQNRGRGGANARGRGRGGERGRGRGRGRGNTNAQGGRGGERPQAVRPRGASASGPVPENGVLIAPVQPASGAAVNDEDEDVEAEVCFICATPRHPPICHALQPQDMPHLCLAHEGPLQEQGVRTLPSTFEPWSRVEMAPD